MSDNPHSYTGLSRGARRVIAGLVILAVAYCVIVVTWDAIAGTATSTEPIVFVIAGLPLVAAIGVVAVADWAIQTLRPRRGRSGVIR